MVLKNTNFYEFKNLCWLAASDVPGALPLGSHAPSTVKVFVFFSITQKLVVIYPKSHLLGTRASQVQLGIKLRFPFSDFGQSL